MVPCTQELEKSAGATGGPSDPIHRNEGTNMTAGLFCSCRSFFCFAAFTASSENNNSEILLLTPFD